MGFETTLIEKTSFIYQAKFDNGLTEHEFDHILVGYYDKPPNINSDEVDSWKWMSMNNVQDDINESPENYTAWFKIIFKKYYKFISQ